MVDTTDMVLDTTDTDTVTSARGLLMPNLRLKLMPLLMLTMDTMVLDTAMDTVMDMVLVMAVPMADTTDTLMAVMDIVTLARDPLMPNPRLLLLLMLTTDTMVMDMVMDTVMAVTMVDTTDIPMVDMDMAVLATMVRFNQCLTSHPFNLLQQVHTSISK